MVTPLEPGPSFGRLFLRWLAGAAVVLVVAYQWELVLALMPLAVLLLALWGFDRAGRR